MVNDSMRVTIATRSIQRRKKEFGLLTLLIFIYGYSSEITINYYKISILGCFNAILAIPIKIIA